MTAASPGAGGGHAVDPARPSARRTVGGVSAVIVAAALPPFLVGAIAPRIGDDFGFRASAVGIAIAGYYVVSGLCSPVAGRVVGSIGPTRALRLACVATTVGLLGIAVAQDATHVVVALALLGLPNSLVQPGANDILARLGAGRTQARSFGIVQASIPSATLLAGVLLPVASYLVDWRWTVVTIGVLALLVPLIVPQVPARAVTEAPAERGRTVAPRAPGGTPLLVALVCIGLFGSIAATSLPSFTSITGLSLGLAPITVAAAQVAGSLSSIAMRILVPIAVNARPAVAQVGTIAVLLVVGVVGFLLLGTGTRTGFVVGAVIAYGCGWGWNALFNLVVVGVRPDGISRATGFTQGGIYIGGTIGPLLFALVASRSDYATAWLSLAGCACGAVLAAAYAARRLTAAPGTRPVPAPVAGAPVECER